VAAIVITGSGEKAFCAGGDIQALYRAISANHAAGKVVDAYPFEFFEQEYRLDYALHACAKPVITIGHGIVMGGGLGILGASRFRVLTEKSRLAVPEITIGLFPDAGASWTLKNMPGHYASWLGMTGSHILAADGLATGMGTHVVAHAGRDALVQDLSQFAWRNDAEADAQMIEEHLRSMGPFDLPASDLEYVPEREVNHDDLIAEVTALRALAGTSDWIDRGLANLQRGCPTTAGVVLEQLRRVRDMTLADSFRMELTIATHCARNPDFREGVRALLIDKDNAPAWRYTSIESLSRDYVLSHFDPPWPEHPLADLEG
jgi:enoyl-CoA hydratase/carnithine racemase